MNVIGWGLKVKLHDWGLLLGAGLQPMYHHQPQPPVVAVLTLTALCSTPLCFYNCQSNRCFKVIDQFSICKNSTQLNDSVHSEYNKSHLDFPPLKYFLSVYGNTCGERILLPVCCHLAPPYSRGRRTMQHVLYLAWTLTASNKLTKTMVDKVSMFVLAAPPQQAQVMEVTESCGRALLSKL